MEPAVSLAPFQVAGWYSMLEPQGRSKGFREPFIILSATAMLESELILSCTFSNLEDKHLGEQA